MDVGNFTHADVLNEVNTSSEESNFILLPEKNMSILDNTSLQSFQQANQNGREVPAHTMGNFTFLNPAYFGPNATKSLDPPNTISATEVIVHETGHASARALKHPPIGKFYYGYGFPGLMSNIPGEVTPTQQNTLDIINDKENRKTID